MFPIRREQLEVTRRAAEPDFERRVSESLKEDHLSAVGNTPPDMLRRRVKAAIARARSHGLENEASIYRFTVMMFEVAPDFDRHPPIAEALREEGLTPDERMELLTETVEPQEWLSARRQSRDDSWKAAEKGE